MSEESKPHSESIREVLRHATARGIDPQREKEALTALDSLEEQLESTQTALADLVALVPLLAEQQAMGDDWWLDRWEKARATSSPATGSDNEDLDGPDGPHNRPTV